MPHISLWTFDDPAQVTDSVNSDGAAQNGSYVNGASAFGGRLVLDGNDDHALIPPSGAYQLATGTIVMEFTPGDEQLATLLSRDSSGFDDGGHFSLSTRGDGSIFVRHQTTNSNFTYETPAGFYSTGDDIRVTYSWDQGTGGEFKVENLTTSASHSEPTSSALTLDMGSSFNEPWVIGADSGISGNNSATPLRRYFEGEVDYVSIFDSVEDPGGPFAKDGIVEGTSGDDLIDTAYTGDPEGDLIDAGDATGIFGTVGDDDYVLAGDGNDTVEAGLGDDQVFGGAGDDSLVGGTGDDTLFGDGGAQAGQWQYQFYDYNFSSANGQAFDIENGNLIGEGLIEDFDVQALANQTRGTSGNPSDFGIIYTATLTTVEGGTYRFNTTSDDGSTLQLFDSNGVPQTFANQTGGTDPFLDNDFHQAPTTRFGDVTLAAGQTYTIQYRYWENAGQNVLSSTITTPSGATEDILTSDLIGPPPLADPGAGDDVLVGGAGADELYGGAGEDTLTGGADADRLEGGDDDDWLNIGSGDTAIGGGGDDAFVIDPSALSGGTITVTGGEDDEDGGGDVLDFNGQLQPGTVVFDPTPDGSGGLSGTATLLDGTVVNFANIETVICFTAGTRILTPVGDRPIEALCPGDPVITRDHGPQRLRWIGRARVPAMGELAPVRIGKGVMGATRDLLVSPQHRMLWAGGSSQLYFEADEVLVAAKHLVDNEDVRFEPMESVEYVHLMFDHHEVLFAEGAPSESFHPGHVGIDAITDAARDELFAIFPDLRTAPDGFGPMARPCLKSWEAALIVAA